MLPPERHCGALSEPGPRDDAPEQAHDHLDVDNAGLSLGSVTDDGADLHGRQGAIDGDDVRSDVERRVGDVQS